MEAKSSSSSSSSSSAMELEGAAAVGNGKAGSASASAMDVDADADPAESAAESAAVAAAQATEEVDDAEAAGNIAEDYRVWKKNAPFLYDLVLTHALEWPSLTTQFLQRKTRPADKEYSEHELLLGTHTSAGEQNHLVLARVRLPNEDTPIDARKYDDERGELGGYGGVASKVDIKVKINHDGEVNRARYMPQDDYLVGTKTVSGAVHVFCVRDHDSFPDKAAPAAPSVRCVGHDKEGYGLDWSALVEGQLLSGSDDAVVCHWDVAGSTEETKQGLKPVTRIVGAHDGGVGDVQWHKHHAGVFGTVGEDSMFKLWDLRDAKAPSAVVKAHEAESQTLCFSPHNEHLFLTGGADKTAKLWDARGLDKGPLHVFHGHTDEVYKVEFAPFSDAVAGSCGADRRVILWDMARIGNEQTPEDAEDGPPELLFVHSGHTSKVSDFSFNANDPWVVSSVGEDNILQVWQIAEHLYSEDAQREADEKGDVAPITDQDLE